MNGINQSVPLSRISKTNILEKSNKTPENKKEILIQQVTLSSTRNKSYSSPNNPKYKSNAMFLKQ